MDHLVTKKQRKGPSHPFRFSNQSIVQIIGPIEWQHPWTFGSRAIARINKYTACAEDAQPRPFLRKPVEKHHWQVFWLASLVICLPIIQQWHWSDESLL
jgi:surface polysaccharide O-acyltransferase-like enzyme